MKPKRAATARNVLKLFCTGQVARRAFDPTQLFTQRDRLPWFWFFFTVAVLLLSAMDRYHIVSQFKQRERVVIIDPAGTCYLSPLLQFSEARDLPIQPENAVQPQMHTDGHGYQALAENQRFTRRVE